ncbi:hypothetical protein SAMN05216345_105229 [Cupriavidus sp. YR651]|uniref:hypothetical protein n=1 Tax=Cupriavidus sp. YR651 TaxID=1855315 RepID=UPI000880546B|nr:hypothetical protein [Cupriavidus sp. YR651]SDD01704.1 hypothetical protein SAMN05216345_105229 [Cupriavidus sp. YR651]
MNTKILVISATLLAAFFGSQAHAQAGYGNVLRDRSPFVDGARTTVNTNDDRNRQVDMFTDGARIAGMDRTGPSADPSRQRDVFSDGAREVSPFTDGARLAGMDRSGVSASPAREDDNHVQATTV